MPLKTRWLGMYTILSSNLSRQHFIFSKKKSPYFFFGEQTSVMLGVSEPFFLFPDWPVNHEDIVCMCFISEEQFFLLPVCSSLCTDPPPPHPPGSPQKNSEKGPLLRFFLRGGGVCTQASQSISLVLKAETQMSVISEAEVRSFPKLLLYQLTKYSNLFLVLYYPEYQTPVISLLGKPRLKTTPKWDHLNRRRMLQSFLLYKILTTKT